MATLRVPSVPQDLTSEFDVIEWLKYLPEDLGPQEDSLTAGEGGMWPTTILTTEVDLGCSMARDRAYILIFLYNSVPASKAKWVHGDLGTDKKKKDAWEAKLKAWENDMRNATIGSKSIFRRVVRAHVLSHNAHIHIDNLWLAYQYYLKPADIEEPDAIRTRQSLFGNRMIITSGSSMT
jgi:hypothetical protein